MKRIFISQRVDVIENYKERRDALDQKWAELLWEAGCIALPVPNHALSVSKLLESPFIDGIILSGGNSPVDYGGSAPERDNADKQLISYAVNNNKPLLGVCRGMQSIVLYFGGTLKKTCAHIAVRHDLDIGRNVNSYHEYAPDMLGGELTALAKTANGDIEYIKHAKLQITGIMWHPEREISFASQDIRLIQEVFTKEHK